MKPFSQATTQWFTRAFGEPTEVQTQGWQAISSGDNALLIAPTGSGKTLAAFLWSIDQLLTEENDGVHTLYVSPLKALVYDIERNLREPLRGIRAISDVREPRVAIRTGDTSSKERNRQLKNPADILVTTPESLFLLLTSRARNNFANLKTIIVDEIHAIAGSKRGAHLAVSLERLAALNQGKPPQRIGLSATVKPATDIARFLVGPKRKCRVIDCAQAPNVSLSVAVPVADMTDPLADVPETQQEELEDRGMWVALLPRIIAAIEAHKTTLVFVNSRNLCERLTSRIREHVGDAVRSHHGSLSQEERKETEESLKRGEIRAIVATSSLELGIDMGSVDLVVMPETPPSTASALQRIGRAGHGVGQQSEALFLPKHQGQLLIAGALAKRIITGNVEPIRVISNPLDVAAQHIVSMVAMQPWQVDELHALFTQTAPFAELTTRVLETVLDMLDGKYPSVEFSELRPRLTWDRQQDIVTGNRGAQLLAVSNAGTIPDRGQYPVHLGEGGPRIGELDEEMVFEMLPGQTFLLGTSTWRIEGVTHDRVNVSPAPGEPGRLPFWRGEGASRPYDLGRDVGVLTRELLSQPQDAARRYLKESLHFDDNAAANTLRLIDQQKAHCGVVPSDKHAVIERFEDELGDQRIVILTPFGRAFHAAWSLYLQATLESLRDSTSQTVWSDDGIIVSALDCAEWSSEQLVPKEDDLEDVIAEVLLGSPLFATLFREAAGRSLLLPRKRPGKRSPLWLTRLRAQKLLAVAKRYEEFPIVLEAHREALRDVLDIEALKQFARDVSTRQMIVADVEVDGPSPMARGLVNTFVGNFMYQNELPLAERKMAALTVDQSLLRELLGGDAPSANVEPETAASLEQQLQLLHHEYPATSASDLRFLLARLGDLTREELLKRIGDNGSLIETAVQEKQILEMRIGSESRLIAINEAGLYRDAIGITPGVGLAEAYLKPVENALTQLLIRFARTHAVFTAKQCAARWQLPLGKVTAALDSLVDEGQLIFEAIIIGEGPMYCDRDVAKRLRRLTIAALRQAVQPVTMSRYAAFLASWHGLRSVGGGNRSLRECVAQLQGIPLPFSDLINHILPARLSNFSAKMLSDACARGEIAWVGAASLGKYDGRVILYLRENLRHMHRPIEDAKSRLSDEAQTVLAAMEMLRAAFLVEITSQCSELSQAQVTEGLWELVWLGLVTNDTLDPLLSRQRKRGKQKRMPSGRWSLTSPDLSSEGLVKQSHAQVMQLLDACGVVSKHHPQAMGLTVRPVYAVLFEAERAGLVRSGVFVDGFTGMQFASPQAIDLLRDSGDTGSCWLLAADDPANPYGAAAPWPKDDRSLRRSAGASVVLVDGEAVVYLDKRNKKWILLCEASREDLLRPAILRIAAIAQTNRHRELNVSHIDGERAKNSDIAPLLRDLGFKDDYDGFVFRARATDA